MYITYTNINIYIHIRCFFFSCIARETPTARNKFLVCVFVCVLANKYDSEFDSPSFFHLCWGAARKQIIQTNHWILLCVL